MINSLNNIISAVPSAIAVLDTGMRYLSASLKWVKDFDLEGKQFLGISHLDLFPETTGEMRVFYEECLQGYSHKRSEDKIIKPDGTIQWLCWNISPWLDDQDKIGGIVLHSEDITARMITSEQLKHSLELYEVTNEVARIGSWDFDFASGKIFWSPMVKQIHETKIDFLPDFSNTSLFFKEGRNRDTFISCMKNAVEKGVSFDEDLEMVTAKGNELWVRIRGNAQCKDGICTRIFGTIQDIQHSKLQTIRLQESEEKYKSIIENSLNAFFLIEPDGTILEANQAAITMFGYSLEELKQIGRSTIVDTSDPNFRRYLALRDDLGFAKSEVMGIRKNQERFPIEISSVTFLGSNGIRRTSVNITDIAERIRSEETLRLSEAQFRAAFEHSASGMSLVGLDGKWIRVNESFCDIVGYSAEELLTLSYQQLTHPDDLTAEKDLIYDDEGGMLPSYQFEKRYLHKNGSIVWVLLAGSIIMGKDQKPSHRIVQIQDITERKKIENELQKERKLLRTLIDNIPLNIFVKDLNSRKTLVNKAEVDYLGLSSAEEILGKADRELFPAEMADITMAEDQEVFISGNPIINREKTVTWADGSLRMFLTSKIPLFNDKGVISGLLGINYDISKIKAAENALFESEQKFRKIFENIQDVFYQTDQYGIITEISPSIEKHSGYTREELIGRTAGEFYDLPEDRIILMGLLMEQHSVVDYEVRLKKKSGEIRYSSVNAQLIFRNGEIIGSEGSMRDVTDRKIQKDSLKSLNNDLNLLNDQKNKLLSVIAHDLRNPISGCVGLLEVVFMETETATKEDLVEYMVMMQKSILNAHELLIDLLEWAKIQFNTADFNPVFIADLRNQVKHCLKKVEQAADSKQINITEDIEDGMEISLDKYMLDAIIRNLVTNSIKFSNRGGIIKVSAQKMERGIRFSVRDNGIGIATDDLGKLFTDDTGFTSYGTQGEKGTGMGLGLCRNFVEKHGGSIWVESTVGVGSTFYFYIPDQRIISENEA